VEILEKHNDKVRAKASDFSQAFNRGIKCIQGIDRENKTFAITMLDLWREAKVTGVKDSQLPDDVKRFLLNVMIASYRKSKTQIEKW
jgi:hypothetical protein